MTVKYVCDSCGCECSKGAADMRLRTKSKNKKHDLLLSLRANGAHYHICDDCWNDHARQFAEAVLSDSPPATNRYYPHEG